MLYNVGLEIFVIMVDVVAVSVVWCSFGFFVFYVIVSDELFSDRLVLIFDGMIIFFLLVLVMVWMMVGVKMWCILVIISRGYSVFIMVIES